MPQNEWEKKLEDALVRVQGAIARAQQRHEEQLKAQGLDPSRYSWDWHTQRRAWKNELRRQRRRVRREREMRRRASKPQGFVFAGAAAILLALAVTNPAGLWWLVFIAFGFGQAAASILGRAYAQKQLPTAADEDQEDAGLEGDGADQREPKKVAAPAGASGAGRPVAAASDPNSARLARIDGLCDKLNVEIKSGREALRTVVQNPEQTVQALRTTCHELARREGELRKLVTAEDEARLIQERDQLSFRIGAEKDEVVRARLGSALSALDEQLQRRGELMTDAARLDAESTRLLYTLENLYTQVLRVRSADAASADVAGAGLRSSLEQLGHEIDSVAEALEAVSREKVGAPLSPISGSADDLGAVPSAREHS